MKYLSHYIQEAQTECFRKHGAFFAFSNKQFNEQKEEGIKYMSLPSGMIAPEVNIKELVFELDKIHTAGIKADIAENGKAAIIQREMNNHECQITMDPTDAVEALEGYGISEEEIKEGFTVFMDYCREYDLF